MAPHRLRYIITVPYRGFDVPVLVFLDLHPRRDPSVGLCETDDLPPGLTDWWQSEEGMSTVGPIVGAHHERVQQDQWADFVHGDANQGDCMGFQVTEEIRDVIASGNATTDTARAFLDAAINVHQQAAMPVRATGNPSGVFRHATGAFPLSDVRGWSTSPAPDHGCGISVDLQDRPILGLEGTDAARFIDIFSRWEVK